MATTLAQQANDTIALWLAQLAKDASVLMTIRERDVALMHQTDRAVYDTNHKILKKYWGDIGTPSYDVCRTLSTEISRSAYETRVHSAQFKLPFDDAVKNLTYYKKTLESKPHDNKEAASLLGLAMYHYDTAQQSVKDAMIALERSNMVASKFFARVASLDAEVRSRLNKARDAEFPSL